MSYDRQKRAISVLAIAQGTADIGSMLIKGINALVDAKRASLFNNAIKMLNANVEITHNRLITLQNCFRWHNEFVWMNEVVQRIWIQDTWHIEY